MKSSKQAMNMAQDTQGIGKTLTLRGDVTAESADQKSGPDKLKHTYFHYCACMCSGVNLPPAPQS